MPAPILANVRLSASKMPATPSLHWNGANIVSTHVVHVTVNGSLHSSNKVAGRVRDAPRAIARQYWTMETSRPSSLAKLLSGTIITLLVELILIAVGDLDVK
jgi:hypothetical protein